MRCALIILCLISAVTGVKAALPSSPDLARAAIATRSAFRADARMDASLTSEFKDRPLGKIMASLSRQLRVPLLAEGAVTDDRATLFVKERPAGECLERLAAQFGFRWRRKGKGYQLGQDLRSLRWESTLRERDVAAQLAALESRMAQVQPEAPNSAVRAREMERALLPVAASLPYAERQRRIAEWNRLRREGTAPVAIAVYRSLTPAQVRQLVEKGELFLASPNGTLPPALAERVNRLASDLSNESLIEPPLQAHVDIRLDEGPVELAKRPADPVPQLSLRFTLTSLRRLEKTSSGEPDTRPTFGPKRPPSQAIPQDWSPEAPPEPPAPAAAPSDDPFLQREVDLPFARAAVRATPSTTTPAAPRNALLGDSAWPADWVTLGEIAEALHTAAGIDLLADSFVRARIAPEKVAGKRTLGSILEVLAKEWRYEWRREGNLLLRRSRAAHWDRIRAVPERILRPWLAQVTAKAERPSEPSLDDLAALASSLTDRQCRGMQEYWGWQLQNDRSPIPPPAPDGFYNLREHLRLWASLDPVRRQRAASGPMLPVSELTAAQARRFLAAVTSIRYETYLPLDRRTALNEEAIAEGGLHVGSERLFEQEYIGTYLGGEVMYRSSRFPDLRNPKPLQRLDLDDPEGFDRITWAPAGSPLALGTFRFEYHLGGAAKPIRTVSVEFITPAKLT